MAADDIFERNIEQKFLADSMLETSWAQRARRSWTTLTSFGVQVLVIGCLLLLPLWKTVGLPFARTVSTPVILGRRSAEALHESRTQSAAHMISNLRPGAIMQPSRVPPIISRGPDSSSSPFSDPREGIEGIAVGSKEGPALPFIGGTRVVMPTPPTLSVRTFRTSKMLEGSLINRVRPEYPSQAKIARIQGAVVLSAIISKAGEIENLHVVSGHPMLVRAAIEAVSRWRYRPYILNGEPVEVETQIMVNFTLGES